MIKKLKEIEKGYIQHDPLTENTMDNEDAFNISLFMEEVIKVIEKSDKRLKNVEKILLIDRVDVEVKPFVTDGVDNMVEK